MKTSPREIKKLPSYLIDQIKAGEIIERPALLIKELIENSLDSEAKKISLKIDQNGLDLISIIDDGKGMYFEDLPLAFERHATSKLSHMDDFQHLLSYGFRGEALASIASVAKIRCLSQHIESQTAGEYCVEGGLQTSHHQRENLPNSGTELYIKELFYNTPTRLKFIQSGTSEKNLIKKILQGYALIHYKISFDWQFDEEERIFYPSEKTFNERLLKFLNGTQPYSYSLEENYYDKTHCTALVIHPNQKTSLKNSYIFINDRFLADPSLQKIFQSFLAQLQPQFAQAIFVIQLKIDPENIDVNIHPNKTKIKFLSKGEMISLVQQTLKKIFSNKSTPIQDHEKSLLPVHPESMQNNTIQQHYRFDGVFSPHHSQFEKTNSVITNLIYPYAIIEQETRFYLISFNQILKYWVNQNLIKDVTTTPLLVSEIINIPNNDELVLKLWSEFGFEIELLKNKYVLREIPDWFNGFPVKEFVEALMKCHPDDIDFHHFKVDFNEISHTFVESFFQTNSISQLVEMNVIKEINSTNLSKWFSLK